MKTPLVLVALVAVLATSSCGDPKKSARGFRLPEGDPDLGKIAFVALDCHRCHTVSGVELPDYEGFSPVAFELGGEVVKVRNHGQLVTSIINPQHVVSEKYLAQIPRELREEEAEGSAMISADDRMTVTQLIDIVAFLQSRYRVVAPDFDYHYYPG